MKILVVTSCRAAVNSIRPETNIFCGLAKQGHAVTVMTVANEEQLAIFEQAGVRVVKAEPLKKICLDTIKLIRKELAEHNFDIVYATNSKAIPNAGFACIGFNTKLVVYRGTTGGLYRHDPTAYLTILHPRVDGVICVSDAVRRDVVSKVWKNKKNVVTIYKGHDLAWYQDVQKANREQFGINAGDFIAICAANVRPSKGIDVMLEATNGLADLENFHLLLAGKNMDKEPYLNLINKSKMSKRIHLLGYRTDVPALVKACNVLVQPSISGEGLPRAVMEAMAIGTAVIITTTGGGKEIVEDGVSGFIVPVKSAAAIADRIRQLHSHPELVEKMSANGLAKIGGELSAATTIKDHADYFNKLITVQE